MFYKILEGVQACHEADICHRDLKAQNILVDENDDKIWNPKICDFGFAARGKELLEEKLGTACYIAPEIYKKKNMMVLKLIFSV